jgi:5S rRNA maturation endonuclease (ribonuclease M5)
MSSDTFADDVMAAFAADPRRLLASLGLEVDEARSKGRDIWVYDGQEDAASLHIQAVGDKAGLWFRFGDAVGGNCFGLVQRYKPTMSFRQRLELVAQVYGVVERENAAPRRRDPNAPPPAVVAEHRYPVIAAGGEIIALHMRQDLDDGGKTIWWERPDGTRGLPEGMKLTQLPLYRAQTLKDRPTAPVIICEGEKDADACAEAGFLALGSYGADVVPEEEVLRPLKGHRVYVWPDNDAAGMKHANAIAGRLAVMGVDVTVLRWEDAPAKAGAADWFAMGKTADELRALAKACPRFIPQEQVEAQAEAEIAGAVNAAVSPGSQKVRRGAVHASELVDDIVESVNQRRDLQPAIYGLRSGWPTLDWHYFGFKWEKLMVVLGDSHSGKTSMGRQMFFATAEALLGQVGSPRVLYYDAEGGNEQFLTHYTAWKYGVAHKYFDPGGRRAASADIEHRIEAAVVDFAALPIYISQDYDDAEWILCDIERQAAEGPIEGVIIDNLQKLDFGKDEWRASKRMAARMLRLGEQLRCPIVMLSQINRDNRNKDWNARGGPEWFNAADVCFFLERGDQGMSREERSLATTCLLSNVKRRHRGTPCKPLLLEGDPATKRLWEQNDQRHSYWSGGASEEDNEWPNG